MAETKLLTDEEVFGTASQQQASFEVMPGVSVSMTPEVQQQAAAMGANMGIAPVAKDIGIGLTEVPQAAGRGLAKAGQETLETGSSLADWLKSKTDAMGIPTEVPVPKTGFGEVDDFISNPLATGGRWVGKLRDAIPDPTTVTGNVAEGISQFVGGYIMAGRYLKAFGIGPATSTAGKIATEATKEAIAGGTAFDPHEDRLSNLVQSVPWLQNPVSAYLAADPSDSEAEGRFKSALENTALAGMAEGLFHAVKGIKAKRAGNLDEAVKEAELAGQAETKAKETEEVGTGEQPSNKDVSSSSPERPGEGAGASPAGPGTEATPKVPPKVELSVEDQSALRSAFRETLEDPTKLSEKAGSVLYKNMDRVTNSDEAKAFANILGEVKAKEYEAARGRKITLEDVEKEGAEFADIVGVDKDVMLQRMGQDLDNLDGLYARVAGYRMLAETSAKRASELAQAVIRGDTTQFGGDRNKLYAEFLSNANLLSSFDPMVEGIKSQLGRNLSALRANAKPIDPAVKAKADAGDAAAADAIKASGPDWEGGEKAIKQLAFKLAAEDNAKSAYRVAKQTFERSGAWDVHNEYWINSILSGPKTHAVNMLTGFLRSAAVMPAERMMAGAASFDPALFREGVDQYAGMMRGLKDSIKLTGRSLKQGEGILDPTNLTYEQKAALSAEKLGVPDSLLGATVNAFGNLVRLPSRMLTTEDELFKQLNYRGRVYALASKEGREMGLKGKDLGDYVATRLDTAFDANGKALDESALQYAREVTYTQDLLEGTWGRSLQDMANRHPSMRVIVPFVRTPTNIMRDLWTHTPGINLLQKEFREEIAAGGERRAMAASKMMAGSALWATALDMAMSGQLIGGGPSDPKAKESWQLDGRVPYSFKLTDENGKTEYVSFNRLDPYGMFFGLATDIAEISGHLSPEELDDVATASVTALAKNLSSKTYLSGLVQLAGVLDSPDTKTERALMRQAGSYIPSIQKEFSGADNLVEAKSIVDALKARTPGYGKVDPNFDALGKPIPVIPALGPDWLSPFPIREGEPEFGARSELQRLAQMSKSSFGSPSKKVGNVDLTDIRMPNGWTAFARLQELTGEVKLQGKTLEQRLEEFFKSDIYKNRLTDSSFDYDGSRLMQTQAIFGAYREAAKQALAKENPEVKAALDADLKKRIDTLRFGPPR